MVCVAKSRETAELKRWCTSSFGAGPTEGDKSPQTTSWASNLVAGHYVEIKASLLQVLHSFLPPNTLNSLTCPKVSWGAFITLSQMESHPSLQLLDYYACEVHFCYAKYSVINVSLWEVILISLKKKNLEYSNA